MAKAKTRKSARKKQKLENEILIYIYALILITLSIIGALQIGFIGEMLTGIIRFVFGNLFGIIYAMIIGGSILMLMKRNISDIPSKYLIAASVILLAWMLAASLPEDTTLKGMDIFGKFMKDSMLVLKGEIAAKGGLIGAFLVSLCTFLFDYKGTWIIIVALLLLGAVLLFSGQPYAYIKKIGGWFRLPFQALKANREEHQKSKTAKKQQKQTQREKVAKEKTQQKQEQVLNRISLDDRVKPGQVSFLDIDEDFDLESSEDKKSGVQDDPVIPTIKVVDNQHDLQEDKRIIEETVGKEDTFISAFDQDYTNYKLPRLTLLNDSGKRGKNAANVNAANESGRKLIQILDEFGVKATLIATHIGPSVTKFEVKPDLGVRVNKISNLQNDIKMALAAKDIRIEAPIPGKSSVGIEIPNIEKTNVSMKELMKNVPVKYAESKTLFALGKDLMGKGVYGELNRMPHLLIAGATGSGKSVCVNSIITSILLRAKPDEVKLLLIDPKKVEFTPYQKIPHLLGPVITDGEKANSALKVIVVMMEQRYELFSMAGVRNIQGYNEYLEEHPEETTKKLPWIVVIIDELADLMLVAAKEVEASIQRITQLARAAGIHLVVATQRPSVDVITGVIKANIPSRIAFAVSSAVDSRTILDQSGAEKLLGYGDMLYVPVGDTVATRVQGAYVSDTEVQKIADSVSSQAKPRYEDAFLRLEELNTSSSKSNEEVNDPLYEEVRQFIIESRKASTSLIQRKFSIGYARAARLIDTLEERRVIGPSRGSKPREVYIANDLAEDSE